MPHSLVLAALASVNLVGNAIWAPMLLKENIGIGRLHGFILHIVEVSCWWLF